MNKWLVSLSTSPAVRTRMILFPFAGAGPAAFADWADHLPPGIELFAVQLPGRAARFTEPLRRRLLPMVDELVPALDPHLAGGTVFFGHSMGACSPSRRRADSGSAAFFPGTSTSRAAPAPG